MTIDSSDSSKSSVSALESDIKLTVDRWCFGVQNYPGEIYPKLIFKVIKQLAPAIKAAVEGNLVINLVALGQHLAQAGKYVVSEQEIILALAGALPCPTAIDPSHHETLANTLGVIEQVLPGSLSQVKDHWELERMRSTGRLSF